jgi:XTP/dITP diphosphohydrolase
MSATALLVATRSEGKLREIRPIFAAAGLTLVSLDELEIEESSEEAELEPHATFEENALSKARYFYEVSGGIPTIADDSGLEVAALRWAAGRSKQAMVRAGRPQGRRISDLENNRAL